MVFIINSSSSDNDHPQQNTSVTFNETISLDRITLEGK